MPPDRFDDVPRRVSRVGAHRAEQPRMRAWPVVMWALLACIILSVGGVFAVLVVSGRVELFPEETVAGTQEPTVAPVVDSNYAVLILNGTAQSGLASDTEVVVVAAGWPSGSVEAAESSSTNFEKTVVYYATAEDEAAALGLAEVIGGALTEQSDAYHLEDDPTTPDVDEAGAKRLVLVVGEDRATPEPDATSG